MADCKPTERHEEIQFRQLLEEAVSKPGTLMRAYSLFWSYSLGNQILALIQANRRGITLGPIASFNRWKELGRHVKRGEKAIELCMPITTKLTVKEKGTDGNETEITFIYLIFAAQRPDANVMPMQLRANLGNRLVLRVDSEGTSEIALGEKGAERLLGRGHLLAKLEGESVLHYAQVPFITSELMDRIISTIASDKEASS
jgi:hypothetical protein